MIIMRLIGGLGNQLFQYSLGRKLAIKNNVPLKLDISDFETYKLHKYALFNYNIVEDIALKDEVDRIKSQSIIKEPYFSFSPDIMKVSANSYLDGYWQTERYFTGIDPVIREDFTLKANLSSEDKNIAHTIRSCNAVSLHIRRCDYFTNLNAYNTHGVCSLSYYYNAVKFLAEKIDDPHFFIFSDDPKWVVENLHLDHKIYYITHNGADKNYADLWLMSICQHNIIANSSFSWWGAWLNTNKSKIVVSPEPWFEDASLDTKDLIPVSWYKIQKNEIDYIENSMKYPGDSVFTLAKQGALDVINLIKAAEELSLSNQKNRSIDLYQLWLDSTQSQLRYAVYFNLGVMFENISDYSKAEQAYQRSIEENPDFHPPYFNLANLLQHQREILCPENQNHQQEPCVSIIIPCYNQAVYLPEAVASVATQTFSNWEIIIVNDGSPDDTSEVARQLIAIYPKYRITLIEKPNGGLSDARNAGIRVSRGKYILPLDADDKLHPQMIEKTLSILKSNSSIDIVYTNLQQFGVSNYTVITTDFDLNKLIHSNQLNYCSLYRREIWDAVGGYNKNMIYGYEDWDFWIACGEKGYVARYLPEALFFYRVKEVSMFTKALKYDKKLKSQIIVNHPSLYDQATIELAKTTLASSKS